MSFPFIFDLAELGKARGPRPIAEMPAAPYKTREITREKTREKILRIVARSPEASIATLAAELRISAKGIEWQMKRLREEGLLVRIGADRGGHWEVRG